MVCLGLTRLSRRASSRAARSFASSAPPIIDLSPLRGAPPSAPPTTLVEQVASACEQWGFFQVVNHGVDRELCERALAQQRALFALPLHVKEGLRRSANNSRGWYNDELTKQRRDWKEGFDFGATPPMDWSIADGDARNATLDGFNRFPPAELLPDFRPVILEYYDALTAVAVELTRVFSLGLGMPAEHFEPVLRRGAHTSYLRLNYYAPYTGDDPSQLCISPHKDAGYLTVLQQDPTCYSLQVRDRDDPDQWVTVVPEVGALTINTGDMAQIYSNSRYHAPEHRVLTNPTQARYSAPFFYNPAYSSAVCPLPSVGQPQFDDLYWGYFRANRFAGDFADYGTEIQISDFAKGSGSWHVTNQERFMERANFDESFDLEANRPLLTRAT